jgi:hypothetical protein
MIAISSWALVMEQRITCSRVCFVGEDVRAVAGGVANGLQCVVGINASGASGKQRDGKHPRRSQGWAAYCRVADPLGVRVLTLLESRRKICILISCCVQDCTLESGLMITDDCDGDNMIDFIICSSAPDDWNSSLVFSLPWCFEKMAR